jgi:ATP-dependent Clp protease adaptor protein ClpS
MAELLIGLGQSQQRYFRRDHLKVNITLLSPGSARSAKGTTCSSMMVASRRCDAASDHVRFTAVPREAITSMSRRETEFDRELVTETKKKLKKPPLYKVLLHNDDYTTKEFVVQVLQYVFHKEQTEAVQIMLHVHKKGIGVAGVYTYEIAETKVTLVENLARQHEYPLKCTMEEA